MSNSYIFPVLVCCLATIAFVDPIDTSNLSSYQSSDETSGLTSRYMELSNFCLVFRDYVLADVKKTKGKLASVIFGGRSLRSKFTSGSSTQTMCEHIGRLDEMLRRQFDVTRAKLADKEPTFFAYLLPEHVNCATVKRVIELSRHCQVLSVAYYS